MKILFLNTGAIAANEPQPDPDKSTGGYISTSTTPQGLDQLFSEISQYGPSNNLEEIRCLALKNITSNVIEGIKIYTDMLAGDSLTKLYIGLQEPNLDDCSAAYFEYVSNIKTAPAGVVFQQADKLSRALEIDELAAGSHMGLWIKRVFNKKAFDEMNSDEKMALQCTQSEVTPSTSEWSLSVADDLNRSMEGQYFLIDTLVSQYIVWLFADDRDKNVDPSLLDGRVELRIIYTLNETGPQIVARILAELAAEIETEELIISNPSADTIHFKNTEMGTIQTESTIGFPITIINNQINTELSILESYDLVLDW